MTSNWPAPLISHTKESNPFCPKVIRFSGPVITADHSWSWHTYGLLF